ncbi:hypothetical protein JCM10213v2_005938 [Rhodosporidiobolus nylandii]
MSTDQSTVICGVTCACASKDPILSAPTAAAVPLSKSPNKAAGGCDARDSCAYAKDGKCACGGVCMANQAKQGCARGMKARFPDLFLAKADCDCAAGTCKAAESARASCEKNKEGACSCAPGQCAAAGFTA